MYLLHNYHEEKRDRRIGGPKKVGELQENGKVLWGKWKGVKEDTKRVLNAIYPKGSYNMFLIC